MDTTQTGMSSGHKHKIAFSIALLVVAVVLVGMGMARSPETSPDPMGVRTDKTVLSETRYIAGTITSIAPGTITIQANIKDMDAGSERYIEPEELRMVERTYVVNHTKETAFVGKPLAEIQIGDRVTVTTKERIYERDTVTAITVTYFDPKEETITRILGNRSVVAGIITKIVRDGDRITIFVKTSIPDESALRALDLSQGYSVPVVERTYEVNVVPETTVRGAEVGGLEEGATVTALVDGDIYITYDQALAARTIEVE